MASASTATPRPSRALLALAVVTVLAAAAAGTLGWRQGVAALDSALADKLSITTHGLASGLERLRYLPRLLAEDPRLRAALANPGDPAAIQTANDVLRRARTLTEANEIYMIAPSGRTLAASNWDEEGSFVGMDYGFRPYFRDAIMNGSALYYAVGVTTGRPGAFLSARVGPVATPDGVMVVKSELANLEQAWTRAGEIIAIADAQGVVFLSSLPDWRYRPLQPLPGGVAASLTDEQRYHGMDLAAAKPLPIQKARLDHPARGPLRLRQGLVPGTDWQLLVGLPLAPARNQAVMAGLIAGTAGLMLTAIALNLLQRRQILRLRLEEADRLELRVEERTRELAQEIQVRARAQEDLRRTHDSLVHAAKLAVLGRMSAAIVHEVGQSLSALDNNLAAAELHGQRGSAERLELALTRARAMLQRLQGVVSRLRGFGSRQVPVTPGPVDLSMVLGVAAELVEPRAKELGTRLLLPEAPLPAVFGDGPRLEQVLTNLLLNAVEATARTAAPRQVAVRVQADAPAHVEIRICDTGPGMPPDVAAAAMAPFVTTRPGEGMGLGLYIVQSLLDQMQGQLHYEHEHETVAVVRMPALPQGVPA